MRVNILTPCTNNAWGICTFICQVLLILGVKLHVTLIVQKMCVKTYWNCLKGTQLNREIGKTIANCCG